MAFQISKDELESLYYYKGLSCNKIAEMLNTSGSTILSKMKLYDIPRRDLSECKIGSNNPNYNNGDKLKEAWLRGCYSNRDVGGSNNPNYKNKLEVINCHFCGEQFTGYPSQHPGNHIFCSQNCAGKYNQSHRTGELQIGMVGYHHTVITKQKLSRCRLGKPGYKHTDEHKLKMSKILTGKKRTAATRQKMSEVMTGKWVGKLNPNWKGGISHLPYCEKFNLVFKEYIRVKFNHTCFICGISQDNSMNNQKLNGKRPYKLSIHHVNYNKDCLCDDLKCYFIPLCISCHGKTNNNREHWENIIIDKLGVD